MADIIISKDVDIIEEKGIKEKKGDVIIEKDLKIKCDVYRIRGEEPSLHYITLSGLFLPQRYLYITFRPLSRKYFIIKMESVLKGKKEPVIVSISNIINKLKISNATLDVPYYFTETTPTNQATPTPDHSSCWTCLAIDLHSLASDYWGCGHEYITSITIHANLYLKSLLASDVLYRPHTNELPPILRLPVTKGLKYEDTYHFRIIPQQMFGDNNNNNRIIKLRFNENHKEVSSSLLSLNKLIGSSATNINQLILSKQGNKVYYTCQNVIIALETKTLNQEFFIGHTEKVMSIALSCDGWRLASAQFGGVVRLWDTPTVCCLSVIKSNQLISGLSLSYTGAVLACIGRAGGGAGGGAGGKKVLSIWNDNDLNIKSITDVDINVLRISPFDSTRLISCGWNNVRFWRVKENVLRSSPVNLLDYHDDYYTDIQYHPNIKNNGNIYSSSSSGNVIEVDYQSFSVKRVWQLFPDVPGGVAITSLYIHEGFFITGTYDGYVRLWPADFKHVTMETRHEKPIIAVGGAKDGLTVMGASEGQLGMIDALSKSYTTLLRSHTDNIMEVKGNDEYLLTISEDNSVRIWAKQSLEQVYEFNGDDSAIPLTADIHPINNDLIIIGYNNGTTRFINLYSGNVLSEHKHEGSVKSVLFTKNGKKCFVSDSNGSLYLYNEATNNNYILITTLDSIVCSGKLMINDDDTLLGFIGPLPSIVSIYSIKSLQLSVHIDVSVGEGNSNLLPVDACFTSNEINHIVILTNQNRVLKYSAFNGQFISQYTPTHHASCVSVINNSLITGGASGELSVSDYHTRGEDQNYIGTSGRVTGLLGYSNYLISASGNALCHWILTPPTEKMTPPTNELTPPINTSLVCGPWPNVESLTTPTSNETDEILISRTPHGGVELTLTTPTDKPRDVVVASKPKGSYIYNQPLYSKPHPLLSTNQPSMSLQNVHGYNNAGRNNVKWIFKEGLIVYSSGSTIIINNLNTLSNQSMLTGHNTEISTVALSHDGWSLVSASHSHKNWPCEVRIWDIDTHKCTKILNIHEIGVIAMEYSFDDRYLLSAGEDHVLSVYCISTEMIIINIKTTELINAIAWDPINAYEFSSISKDGVTFWILEEKSGTLQTHKPTANVKEMTGLCYSTSNYLFTGGRDGSLSIWNTNNNDCIFSWNTGCREISCMVANSNKVMVGSPDGLVQLWLIDPSDPSPTSILDHSLYVVGGAYSLSFNPQLTMGLIGCLSIFFVNWAERVSSDLMFSHHGNVRSMAYSSDGRVFGSCDDHVTNLWATSDWTNLLQFKSKNVATAIELIDHAHQYLCAIGYTDGSVTVCNITSGRVLTTHRPHKSEIRKLMSSARETSLLLGYSDGLLLSIDAYNGNVNYKISSHEGREITDLDRNLFKVGLPGVVNVNEEIWLISSVDQRISVWINNTLLDWITFPSSNKQLQYQSNSSIPTLSRFSPTEPDVIIYSGYGSEKCLYTYSLTQKRVFKKLQINYWPICLSVSPISQLIAIGSREQVIMLIDCDGAYHESSTHCDAVSDVAFSPSGGQLVSSSQNTHHIWSY
ncbi:PREDICTED: WD repeat-containing protein 90-like [Amphimedon queenslandica]|nr:PREDICTED: WD repeat-containing protein 90-like [Amphimedon queenslandica]|eukprot:XP_019852340.1 PREDICTED: WD repeat-containing protein 90-like [Amphimedon queenslandica]